ncbi:MAG: Tol-Pal system beta propeller repeat protein TolB [Rickettsiales bacterium]
MRAFFALSFLILISSPAHAVLKLDITQGNIDPLPIAVVELNGTDGEAAQVGRDISSVIAADLERSGIFRPIDKGAFIEQINASTSVPRFPDWRQINAQALVHGTVTSLGGGKLKVSFRLWDVYAEAQMEGKQFDTFSRNWRRVAHLIADLIFKRITGEEGFFDTRIVYVSETGPKNKRIKRLAIMDQDGENHKFLTNGQFLVLTPRFSPNTQEILYMSYAGKQPRVYLRDLQTGREESIGTFKGMSFAPRFDNTGNRMVMSIADGGNTEIYQMDLRSRNLQRLTNDPGIDTSPSYSPDGRSIVFNSDRGGSQQLYVMSSSGGGVKRISFGDGRYGDPVWSPRGDLIAFTKMAGGQFSIGVMRSDGSGEREITQSWLDESPSWAPNGRYIVFTRQRSAYDKSRLMMIDVTGRNLREILTPTEATDPAWSPLLP